jgi:hypothetical protein
MKKYILMSLSAIVMLSFSGCDKLMEMYGIRKPHPKQAQNSEMPTELKKVDNASLAKILLKPDRKPINIVRDPFKPLLGESLGAVNPATGKKDEVSVDISLLGIVKLENDYSALLKSKTQKGVFKVGDVIDAYTVQEITGDYVVLHGGEKDIKL